MLIAAIAPIVLLAVAYVAWIVRDILATDEARLKHLPKAGWIAVAILSIPVGGIVYLLIGKDDQ